MAGAIHLQNLGQVRTFFDNIQRDGGTIRSLRPENDAWVVTSDHAQGRFESRFALPPHESLELFRLVEASRDGANAVDMGGVSNRLAVERTNAARRVFTDERIALPLLIAPELVFGNALRVAWPESSVVADSGIAAQLELEGVGEARALMVADQLAEQLRGMERGRAADAIVRELIERIPDDPIAARGYFETFLKLGVRHIAEALECDPTELELQISLALQSA